MNRHFVSIKVNREERPDVDSVYMAVCQAFTGSGGRPTSIFMTPDQKPFFAGTYFPRHSRAYDPRHGGFGRAPKFPAPHNLLFLSACHERRSDAERLIFPNISLCIFSNLRKNARKQMFLDVPWWAYRDLSQTSWRFTKCW